MLSMFNFYLRQTTPFKISDIPTIVKKYLFNRNNQNQEELLIKEINKITESKYLIFSSSMRAVLLKSLEFFRKEYPNKNELIIPEYSFHSNLSCAIKNKYTVKFAPVNQKTLFIDEKHLEKLINNKTLGIIITHPHGQIYDLNKIKKIINKYQLIVFEDYAHSFPITKQGSKNKQNNKLSIKLLSFGSGKFVTAFGGGALTCNNQKLVRYLEASLKGPKNTFSENMNTFIRGCIYITISQPVIAYFFLKPTLALSYLLKNKKIEDNKFDQSSYKPKYIEGINTLQKKLLFLQLITLKTNVDNIIKKRQMNTLYWSKKTTKKQLNPNFCFQLPISVDNPDNFIWNMWKQNIDVQIDYCSYLPKLLKSSKSFSAKKLKFFKSLVYLPSNQYLSKNKIEKIKI